MSTKLKKINRLTAQIFPMRGILLYFMGLLRLPNFIYDYYKYNITSNERISMFDVYPCLQDKSSLSQTGKGHYFYQDIWALSLINKSKPDKHIDIGSRVDGFVGQCSVICFTEFVDIRPVDLGLKNLKCVEGSITHLPYEDNSVQSLSCLHVIEHIGLGRYGDNMNSNGSADAAKELVRVLAKNGNLYIGVPVGRERVEFNAHRIFYPRTILYMFEGLALREFKAIDDSGVFVLNPSLDHFDNADYSCGLFHFVKK